MYLVLKLFFGALKKFDDEYRDKRSKDYPIGGNLFQTFFVVFLYYFFVKHLGPQLMKSRQPLQLKIPVLVYNVLQVLLNGYVVIHSLYLIGWKHSEVPIYCAKADMDESAMARAELHLCYCFVLLKVFDSVDTIIMVLRKRTKQITFLHIYHHIMMVVATVVHFRYIPGGHIIPMGVLNSWVHAVMYFYYFMSALKPELMKNSIRWKKLITEIQLCQFLFLTVFYAVPLLVKNCEYPAMASLFVFLQAVIMVVMFSDFYRKTYLHSKKSEKLIQ